MRTPPSGAKTAELLRLNASVSEDEQLNLKEYVDRRKDELSDIYSIVGESIAVVSSFLILGILRENSLEEKVLKTVEVPQVQYTDRIVGVPVVTERRIPTIQTAQRTTEVPKTVSQDRIPQRTAGQAMDAPVPQVTEEIIEMFLVFIQDRVQQRMVEQTTETTAVPPDEEIMEAPKTQTQEKIICRLREDQSEFSKDAPLPSMPQEQIQERIIEETDVLVPHMMEKTTEVMKLIPQEHVENHTVGQIIDMPVMMQRQVQKSVEVPQIRSIDEAVDVPVIVQRQVPIVRKVQRSVEVPQAQSTEWTPL